MVPKNFNGQRTACTQIIRQLAKEVVITVWRKVVNLEREVQYSAISEQSKNSVHGVAYAPNGGRFKRPVTEKRDLETAVEKIIEKFYRKWLPPSKLTNLRAEQRLDLEWVWKNGRWIISEAGPLQGSH